MLPICTQIFDHYQTRKTNAQKTAFIELLQQTYPNMHIEADKKNKNRNLVFGDVATADVVYTAHYDTCAVMPIPNLIAPRNIHTNVLYMGALLFAFSVVAALTAFATCLVGIPAEFCGFFSSVVVYGLLLLMIFGKASTHTANDNTSGVITVLELMARVPQDANVAFVLFDNEEMGLLGSRYFKKCHKAEMSEKLLVNLDCVSDGDKMLVVQSKKARALHGTAVENAFKPQGAKIPLLTKASNTFYPSDQIGFPCSLAIASLKYNWFFGHYMDRIHTKYDTNFDVENIDYLTNALVQLTHAVCPVATKQKEVE